MRILFFTIVRTKIGANGIKFIGILGNWYKIGQK
jgi:hypothetical protein